jgi:hypothetical protein
MLFVISFVSSCLSAKILLHRSFQILRHIAACMIFQCALPFSWCFLTLVSYKRIRWIILHADYYESGRLSCMRIINVSGWLSFRVQVFIWLVLKNNLRDNRQKQEERAGTIYKAWYIARKKNHNLKNIQLDFKIMIQNIIYF